jgi:hypothetical protein
MDKVIYNNPALFRKYMSLPRVDLKLCEFNKKNRVLTLPSEYIGMPSEFYVRSHHTGKEVRFVAVGPNDELFDEDGWDGEQCIYRPMGYVPNVDHMVIYNLC